MGFSVRIAPGLRLRASSRGMRASLGPRFARVHVGAGAPGVSTGVGPFGYYTSLASRRSGSGSAPRSTAGRSRAAGGVAGSGVTAAEAQDARRRADYISARDALLAMGLHRAEFQSVIRPVAAMPTVPPLEEIVADLTARAQVSISRLNLRARREAAQSACVQGEHERQRLTSEAIAQQEREQAAYDQWWEALLSGDPEVALPFLNEGLADNAQPSAAVDVESGEVTVTLIVPDMEQVPMREPGMTPGGKPTTTALSATRRAELHEELVSAHLLVTAKEVSALYPNLTAVRVIGFSHDGRDAFDQPRLVPLVAVLIDAGRLQSVVRWDLTAVEILRDVCTETEVRRSRGRLVPIDLDDQPDLAALCAQMAEDEDLEVHAPAAGWHDDPLGQSRLRWWDGSTWTEHVSA